MLALIALAAVPAYACSVPVFRYALERWPAEPYDVYVFRRGPLSPEAQKAVDRLRPAAGTANADGAINLQVLDVSGKLDEEAAKVWQRHAAAALPWMVVRYPPAYEVAEDLSALPLTADAAATLVDSPARRQIARRIIEGEAGVFLVLESGDRAKDDAAAHLVEAEIARLQKTLKLPEPDADGQWDDPVYDKQGAPAMRLVFSSLCISRTDPAEQWLVKMLMGAGPIPGADSGPVVFPFFGRGRALIPLTGKNLSAAAIEDICEFMAGPCSCIIKGQNPGVDILMTVDWDAALAGQESAIPKVDPPPLTGTAAFVAAKALADKPPVAPVAKALADKPPVAPVAEAPALWRNVALALVAGVAILAVIAAAIMARRRKESASS